jgi:hypothetical protein
MMAVREDSSLVSSLRWRIFIEVIPAVGVQTDLHDPVGREVCTSKTIRQAFQLRQRHQNQKGWQMRLAQPTICFRMRQVRLAATARLFHFLRNMERPPPRPTGAVVVKEAEDGERVDHVGHNHMAGMDGYVCVHCQHSTLLNYSHGFQVGNWKNAKCT